MKLVALVLLGLSLIIGGLIIQIEIPNVNTTAWNFTGHNIARGLTQWLGALLMLIGSVVVLAIGYEERGS